MSRSETGGPPWVVEGERGTFKFAIVFLFSHSPSVTYGASSLPEGALMCILKNIAKRGEDALD